MLDRDLTTVDLVWRERDDAYHARNPFPVGGVVQDPATGAAAAAFGAYLRELGLVCGALSTQVRGTQTSFPRWEVVERFLRRRQTQDLAH